VPPHSLRNWTVTEQSRAAAYCRQPASTATPGIKPRWDPWPYMYLFNVKTFGFFSSFVVPPLTKREGLDFFFIKTELLYLWRGLHSLDMDRIKRSLCPILLRRSVNSVIARQWSRYGHTKKNSYVIVTSLAAWRADCCLATSRAEHSQFYCCVRVFSREVRCLAIHVTIVWQVAQSIKIWNEKTSRNAVNNRTSDT
jgi:hypothetical protein